jgi:hypothetical protein
MSEEASGREPAETRPAAVFGPDLSEQRGLLLASAREGILRYANVVKFGRSRAGTGFGLALAPSLVGAFAALADRSYAERGRSNEL